MKLEEWKSFEKALTDRGYQYALLHGPANTTLYKVVTNNQDKPKDLYKLIFQFWNYEVYRKGDGYDIDFTVIPYINSHMNSPMSAACSNIGNNPSFDIDFAEKFAKDYYEFVVNELKYK